MYICHAYREELNRTARGIEFVRTESPRVRLCIDGCPSQLLPDSPSIVTLSECILLLRALECVFSTRVMDGALFLHSSAPPSESLFLSLSL